MKNVIFALLSLTILAGCDDLSEKVSAVKAATGASNTHNCVTTGPNSPIVVGNSSVVIIDGKSYPPGQSADCAPGSSNITTYGANSPIITSNRGQVIINYGSQNEETRR
ncbi:hypothetical protein [Pseudomonas sp. S4_EA_1b]|uniref:hypothetical protein n=1 Tax=Pseudomonas sp. S4_EA_1b TaxID=2796960 RepID=UPI0018E62CA3|nr:hypothetical protein [Pseudomonas sp. S4_EA_1b]MBI6599317.1 hypothetical protein [Pseudomonas sp. S4_EA_1b]